MLRHPILVTFDEKRLREQLRGMKGPRSEFVVVPFDDRLGQVLRIPREEYRRSLRSAKMVLEYVERKVRTSDDDKMRRDLWDQVVLRKMTMVFGPGQWGTLLLLWVRTALPQDYLRGEENLARAFMRDGVGFEGDAFVSAFAEDLRRRCDPSDTRQRLLEVAFELQQEKDYDELFHDYAPRVIVLAASLFPVTRIPLVIGWTIQAIAGFLDFMLFLEDAEKDGEVTEAEVKEAKWALMGILPFGVVQIALLLRGVGLLATMFLKLLISGVKEFLDTLEDRQAAAEAGWNGYCEMDQSSAIFIPDYAAGGAAEP